MEKEKATHYSILAGKSYEQWGLAGYNPWGHIRIGQILATKQYFCVHGRDPVKPDNSPKWPMPPLYIPS